jgi:hypothetical protein
MQQQAELLKSHRRRWSYHDHSLRLQTAFRTSSNRLNIINFSALFSGTAIASPRQFDVRLEADF